MPLALYKDLLRNVPFKIPYTTYLYSLAIARAIIKVLGHQHQWFPGCFPGGYNVKRYISRGRLAWWLLAFLSCDSANDGLYFDEMFRIAL